MNNKERLKEIILQLKQIKRDRELSVQDIHDMVMGSGGYTSLSTVRRVFAQDSENKNFRYRDTIQPIAQVLIGVNEEAEPLTAPEADALKNIALLKDNIIKELEAKNAELSDKCTRYEQVIADFEERVHFLREQITRKDDYIDRLAKKAGI